MGRPLGPLVTAASVIIVVAGLKAGSGVLAPVLFALVIAVLVAPFVRRLEQARLPSWLALTVTIVVVLVVGLAIGAIFYSSLNQLVKRIPGYQAMLAGQIEPVVALLEQRGIDVQAVVGPLTPTGSSVARALVEIVFDVLGNVFGVVFFLVLVVLMLAESRQFGGRLRGAAPGNAVIARLDSFTGQIQRQYAIQAASNLVSALAITAMLLGFRVDFAVLWGVLVFFLAFVPNVGLTIAVAPGCVLAFVQHGPVVAAAVIVSTIAINLLMDNIVTPRFMGVGLNMPVLVVFLSLFFWTWVFGPLGALLAMPATLFIRLILESDNRTRPIALLLSGDPEEKSR